jgi:hypothetical protein
MRKVLRHLLGLVDYLLDYPLFNSSVRQNL